MQLNRLIICEERRKTRRSCRAARSGPCSGLKVLYDYLTGTSMHRLCHLSIQLFGLYKYYLHSDWFIEIILYSGYAKFLHRPDYEVIILHALEVDIGKLSNCTSLLTNLIIKKILFSTGRMIYDFSCIWTGYKWKCNNLVAIQCTRSC